MSDEQNPSGEGSRGEYALRLLRVKWGDVFKVVTLSPSYYGLLTHFVGKKGSGRSEICRDDCPPAWHRGPLYWKGYCAVLVHSSRPTSLWYPAVLEITEHCEADLREVYRRGQLWRFSKPKQDSRRHKGIMAQLLAKQFSMALPEPFDIRPVVCNIYHVTELPPSVANSMPARVLVQPLEGPAPPESRQSSDGSSTEPLAFREALDAWKKRYQHLHGDSNGSPKGGEQ